MLTFAVSNTEARQEARQLLQVIHSASSLIKVLIILDLSSSTWRKSQMEQRSMLGMDRAMFGSRLRIWDIILLRRVLSGRLIVSNVRYYFDDLNVNSGKLQQYKRMCSSRYPRMFPAVRILCVWRALRCIRLSKLVVPNFTFLAPRSSLLGAETVRPDLSWHFLGCIRCLILVSFCPCILCRLVIRHLDLQFGRDDYNTMGQSGEERGLWISLYIILIESKDWYERKQSRSDPCR